MNFIWRKMQLTCPSVSSSSMAPLFPPEIFHRMSTASDLHIWVLTYSPYISFLEAILSLVNVWKQLRIRTDGQFQCDIQQYRMQLEEMWHGAYCQKKIMTTSAFIFLMLLPLALWYNRSTPQSLPLNRPIMWLWGVNGTVSYSWAPLLTKVKRTGPG